MKSKFDEPVTAHFSDIHQNELYEEVIASIDPGARLAILQGDWLQCHKNRRPSKGKIKGLPSVDNGFGENVQKWSFEVAAYINNGNPIPKGEKVDFNDIPAGTLRTDSENYETMQRFMQDVVRDTNERLERIAEATYKKHKETGLQLVMFPGHDNAYDFWISELFPDIDTLDNIAKDVVGDNESYFRFVDNPEIVHNPNDNSSDNQRCLVVPLYALPEAKKALREFIGVDKEKVENMHNSDREEYNNLTNMLVSKYKHMLGKSSVLVVASHEGPKEVSDIVLGNIGKKGKATENRKMFEKMFAEKNKNNTMVLWLYGNDGVPIAVKKNIIYGAENCPVTVQHLAELDEKGNPMSNKGRVSYVGHETGNIWTPQR